MSLFVIPYKTLFIHNTVLANEIQWIERHLLYLTYFGDLNGLHIVDK